MRDETLLRKIFTSAENNVLIFLGGAAEFALNPENHWLFYTNNLPSEPQKRFIETLAFTKRLLVLDHNKRQKVAEEIRHIHSKVEENRSKENWEKMHMSNEAFVHVGGIIIDYGIMGYEYLHHTKLSPKEKEDIFQLQKEMFEMMKINWPDKNYKEFKKRREVEISDYLQPNEYTKKLYKAYLNDVGIIKYYIFIAFQSWFVDNRVMKKLNVGKHYWFYPIFKLYPYLRFRFFVKLIILAMFKKETEDVLLHHFEFN